MREDPRHGPRKAGRPHRPFRPDHALARRDGACRPGDAARRLHRAAADRRRHDQRGPHRREDRARIRRRASCTCSTPPASSTSPARCSARKTGPAFLAERRRPAGAPARRSSPRAGRAARCSRSPRPAAAARRSTGAPADIPRPEFFGPRVFAPVPLDEIVPYIDWGPFFSAWELHGRFPDLLEDPTVGPEATRLYARRAEAARPHRRRETLRRQSRHRLLARQRRRRRHRGLRRRTAQPRARHVPLPAPAAGEARRPVQPLRSPTSSRRRTAAGSTTSAASPSPPATASTNSPRSSAPGTTTIPPSWPRRWATGWPRRWPS